MGSFEENIKAAGEFAAFAKGFPFADQCGALMGLNGWRNYISEEADAAKIRNNGFVKEKDCFAVDCGADEYYVYLWKHICGYVFYVGSGKNNRYKSKHRNAGFARELDDGDSVVYIVARGLNEENARKIERYISGTMSVNGCMLTNNDNIVVPQKKEDFIGEAQKLLDGISTDLIIKINNSIQMILIDRNFSYDDAMAVKNFIGWFGDHYFSSGEKDIEENPT